MITTGLRTCCSVAVRSEDGAYHGLLHADDTTSREDILELAAAVGLTEEQATFVVLYCDPKWAVQFAHWQIKHVEDHSRSLVPPSAKEALFVKVTRVQVECEVASHEPPDTSVGGQLTQLAKLWNTLLHEIQPQRFGQLVLNTITEHKETLRLLRVELEALSELGLSLQGDDPLRPATWSKFNDYFQTKYSSMVHQRSMIDIARRCCHPHDYEQACRSRGRVAQLKNIKILLIRTQTVNAVRCFTLSTQPEKEDEVVQRCKKWLRF